MTINVRFVPKGTSFISFDELNVVPVAQAADLVEPSKRQADNGRRALMERGVAPETTSLNRLVVEMSEAQFRQMFDQAELVTEKHTDKRVFTEEASFRRPVEALKIPEALQDSIAFAYIPRPVEYYAPQAVPPHENVYHLRLSDVALALNAPRCHQSGWTGRGSKVAMADSGFWLHPYFVRSGYQLLPTQSPGSGPADVDASGHGTGEAANIFAVAPQCTVYGVKQGNSSAGTLETCIDQKPHVMTNSWGFDIDHRSRDELRTADPDMYVELIDIESVINKAVNAGICVLFSAGNGHLAFPACFPAVIAVGGATLNEDGSIEASNYASGFASKLYAGRNVPDICGLVGRSGAAPQSAHIMLPVPPDSGLDGRNFPSGAKKSGWGIFSGTSAACPQVAGLVALMKQISGTLSPAQIRQVLQARAIDVAKGKTATGATARPGTDIATGAGLVDALRACGYVAGVP